MSTPQTPEEIQRELTDLTDDGAGQQTKVGGPYDGKGDVQTGVRKRLQEDKKRGREGKRDRSLRED
jgi:hypothetical protein